MKHARFPALLTIFAVACSCLTLGRQSITTTAQDDAKLRSMILMLQSRLDQSRRLANFPGAQVGFSYVNGQTADGLPRYMYGSVATGVSDLQTNIPLKTSDRFLLGSIGKTFVSALTLLLAQDAKLNLDDKIEKWLGTEAWFGKLPNAKDITLRMLLNHSSGIENHADLESFRKKLLKGSGRDIKYEELISYVLNRKPLFPAGSGYHYSDTNYILVGMIIEKATGKTLYDLINDRILKPYKLEHIIPSNNLSLPEVVNGYVESKPVIVDGKFTINPQWEWAGGGFAADAEDVARWCARLYNGDVLTAASMDQMLNSTTTGEGAGYGLGIMISRSKWGRSYGHDGEFPGYLSDMRYYTKQKVAISVLVNSDETPAVNRFLASAAEDFAGIIISANTKRQLSQAEQATAQKFTEDWLSLIYSGQFDESWDQLSDRLKQRYTKDRWKEVVRSSLEADGRLLSRKLKTIAYADVDARTVTVEFETSFTKSKIASETITLEMSTGQWRVAGFSRH